MKALTLWQPWASAIAVGLKTYETRGWSTSYRGPLAIHASKSIPKRAIKLIGEETYRRLCGLVEEALGSPLPNSCIVTVGMVAECVPTEEVRELTEQERRLGDYSRERFAWGLSDVCRDLDPVPCVGKQGMWTVPKDVERVINERLALIGRNPYPEVWGPFNSAGGYFCEDGTNSITC